MTRSQYVMLRFLRGGVDTPSETYPNLTTESTPHKTRSYPGPGKLWFLCAKNKTPEEFLVSVKVKIDRQTLFHCVALFNFKRKNGILLYLFLLSRF